MIKENKLIICIIIATIALSLGYAFYFKIQPLVDARAYDRIGWNLARGLGYKIYEDTALNKDPAIDRVGPGYQFFLGGIYSVFGHSHKAVWVIQALIRGLSVLLVYLLCLSIFNRERGKKIGLWAAVLFGFYPDLIQNSAMLMTETLAIFLLLSVTYAFLKFYQEPNFKKILLVSILLFLTIMVRSNAGLLLIVFAGIIIYQKWYKYLAVFILAIIILLTPWTLRNYYLYNKFIPTCTAGGYDIWVGNNILATGELENYEPIEKYVAEHGLIGANTHGVKQALLFIKEHPLNFIWLLLRKTVIYFSFLRPIGFWFYLSPLHQGVILISSAIFTFLVFSLSLAGLFYAWRERNRLLKIFLWILVAIPLGVIPIVVETRYRFVLYPYLAILAGLYLDNFMKKDEKRFAYLACSLATILAVAAADGILSWERLKERIHLLNVFKYFR